MDVVDVSVIGRKTDRLAAFRDCLVVTPGLGMAQREHRVRTRVIRLMLEHLPQLALGQVIPPLFEQLLRAKK